MYIYIVTHIYIIYISICVYVCIYVYVYSVYIYISSSSSKAILEDNAAFTEGTCWYSKIRCGCGRNFAVPNFECQLRLFRLTLTASHLDSKACSINDFRSFSYVSVATSLFMCAEPKVKCATGQCPTALPIRVQRLHSVPMLVQRSALERLSPADPKKTKYPVVVFVFRVGSCTNNITLYHIISH